MEAEGRGAWGHCPPKHHSWQTIFRTRGHRCIKTQHTEPSPEREREWSQKNHVMRKSVLWVYCASLGSWSKRLYGDHSLTSSSELEGRVLVCGPAEELVKAVKSLRLETRHHGHCTTPHHSSPLAIFTQSIFSKIILNIIGNKRLCIDPSHISTGCHGKCQC